MPVIVINVPTGALLGAKSVIVGVPPGAVTLNPFARAATSMPVVIVTVRLPRVAVFEIDDLRQSEFLTYWTPMVMSTSPMTAFAVVFRAELGGRFPKDMTTIPFYVLHAVLFLLTMRRFHYAKKKLLQTYLPAPSGENSHG